MTVLLRSGILRLCAGAAGALTLVGASEVEAQRGPKACTAPSTVLIAFPKGEKVAAAKFRDVLWSTFKDFASGHVCLVLKEHVDGLLKDSSFPIDTVLGPVELVNLAQPLRADEIIELEVIPVGRSVQYSGRVILTRDRRGQLRDSIPKHMAGDIPQIAAKEFIVQFKKVQAMLEIDKKCDQAAREERFPEAEAAAREALKAYPESNIARLCLASVLREAKKSSADIIKLTDEVLATDPKNEIALDLQLRTYLADNNQDKYAAVGSRIIANSPTAPGAEEIISNLAQWKKTEIVIRLLDDILRQDPENVNLRMIEFRLLLAADNLTEAQKKGEVLAKLDTAVVDTVFANRMVNAYARDTATAGSKEKAAEWLSRGTQKWPNDIDFGMRLAQMLRTLGQTQQAVDEYKRILRINPKAPGVRIQIANTYDRANQPDSAYAWIRRDVDEGGDKIQAAAFAYTMGLKKLQAAQASKSNDDWKAAIPVLAYADSLNPADKKAAFYWGVASFSVAAGLYGQLSAPGATPTCAIVKEARDALLLANEKIRLAPNTDAQTAGQVLQNFTPVLGALDGLITQLRCPG